jgi:hypothetical protein
MSGRPRTDWGFGPSQSCRAQRLEPYTLPTPTLCDVKGFLDGAALLLNLFLQQGDGIDQLLRTGGAAGDIHIHWNDLVNALNQRVVLKHTTRGGACAHGQNPLGLGHLFPQLPDHGSHFVRHASGNDHQVALPGRWPENLCAEAGNIEARRPHRHHFNRAAGQAERHGPYRTLAHPVHSRIKRGKYHTLRRGIAEGQIPNDPLAIFHINIRTKIKFASHYVLILNHTDVACIPLWSSVPSAVKVLLWVNDHLAEHLALLKIFGELNQTAGVAYGFWFVLSCTNCTKKLAMLFESSQIVTRNLRLIQLLGNLRARNQPVLVNQAQARDESESFSKLSAFGHSRPCTFRGDLAIQHNCTDINAIDYEIAIKFLRTLTFEESSGSVRERKWNNFNDVKVKIGNSYISVPFINH